MKIKTFSFVTISCFILVPLLFCLIVPAQAQESKPNGDAMVFSMGDKELEWGPCPAFMPEGCGIAVLQGNPEEPNADVFFKMEGNTSVARHWHHSPERMVLVSGEMQVTYDGQDPEVIKVGNYAYGPAELPHKASCLSDQPCVLFIAFEDPVDAMPVSASAGQK